MILGIGIDAVSISRFQHYAREIEGFTERLFSSDELKLTRSQLAGNFSANEAFFKACPETYRVNIASIRFLRDANGKPFTEIYDFSGERMFKLIVHVSLTNMQDLVIASVIIESKSL